MRKSAQSKDIKTEEIATLRGDESPKKSAISLPDENPAPIAVPIYNAAVLNDFFTRKTYDFCIKIMPKTNKKPFKSERHFMNFKLAIFVSICNADDVEFCDCRCCNFMK